MKLIFMFTFVDVIVTCGFLFFGLTVLWSFASAGEGILGLAVLLGVTSVLRALSALVRGVMVDAFQKKRTILVGLMLCGGLCLLLFFVEYGWLLMAAYIAIEFAREVYNNTYAALVAEKLSADDYVRYDAVSIMAGRVVGVAGNLLAAVGIMLLPSGVMAVLVAVVFFAGALVCYVFLPVGAVMPKSRTDWAFAKENVFADRKVMAFVAIVFLLNLDYAFIPTLLPMFIITANALASPLLFGIIKACNHVGEFAAAAVIVRYGQQARRLTKIGLGGSAGVFVLLPFIYTVPIWVVVFFALYSFFDMLTQPMYSRFVASLPDEKRGRVLGIVDSIILLASPLGIIIGGALSILGMVPLVAGMVGVFLLALGMVAI